MKRTIMLLTALGWWLLTACTGATPTPAPTSTPVSMDDFTALVDKITSGSHDTVTSSDGQAELLIPQGALPSGKTAKDIKVTPVDPLKSAITVDGKAPLFAYQLEPDGLVLTSPSVIRITHALSSDGFVPTLFILSGKQISQLTPTTVNVDTSKRNFAMTALVAHFSTVFSNDRSFSVELYDIPNQRVNHPFNGEADVRVESKSVANYCFRPTWITGGVVTIVPGGPGDDLICPTKISQTVTKNLECKSAGDAYVVFQANITARFNWNMYSSLAEGEVTGHFQGEPVSVPVTVSGNIFKCIEDSTPTPTPTNTKTPTPTNTPKPKPTPTVTPTPTLTPIPCPPPSVSKFEAVFVAGEKSTYYTVTADAGAGCPLHYAWSNTNGCGEFKAADSPKIQWHHPDEPGGCPAENIHPATITVDVSSTGGVLSCYYAGGSGPGTTVKCIKRP